VIFFTKFRGGEFPFDSAINLISQDAIIGHALTVSLDSTVPELFIAEKSVAAIEVKRMQLLIDAKS